MKKQVLYQQGVSRDQITLFADRLDDMVGEHSLVRIIELFVDRLGDLYSLGFKRHHCNNKTGGNPAYPPAAMLKLYLYGYINRVRSSRQLERQCAINIEVIWLLQKLTPNFHTISDFRKDNGKAIVKIFKLYNQFLDEQGLFGKKIIAIDGTKIRAVNSKKNNYNQEKINRQVEYIDRKEEQYLQELEQIDRADETDNVISSDKVQIGEALAQLSKRREKYKHIQQQLDGQVQKGETQVSTTDPDSRSLPEHMNIVNVSYNIQTGVDAEHKLIAHYEVTNVNDTYALGEMACDTATALGTFKEDPIIALADAGYCVASELHHCEINNVEPYVAMPEYHTKKAPGFRKEDFAYDQKKDIYICPQKVELHSNQVAYDRKNKKGEYLYKFKRYIAPKADCLACPFYADCVSSSTKKKYTGRTIDRTEYDQSLEANRKRINENSSLYKLRQQIVEHPFGTIKRAWGYTYTLLKSKAKVAAEIGLMFTAYNLRRSVSILGFETLFEALKSWKIAKI